MKNKKGLPVELQKLKRFRKQESINKVLRAIVDINNERRKVTISTLMDFTELSRSFFVKAHIRVLLTDYGYSQNVLKIA